MAHGMQNCLSKVLCWYPLFLAAVILLNILGANSVVVPNSSCYAIDNSSHLVDFTDWVGHPFEFEGKDSDLVVRFCKDVESRSQMGYIGFGRFDTSNHFVAGSGSINFVQEFYKGDLMNCERSYDKMGRTAQVNIICGNCRTSKCKGSLGLGCICNVTYESSCRAIVELAIPCKKQGLRVFEGFTVGFHPHSREIVENGMTHLDFDKAHRGFSFSSEQRHLTLYMSAIASLSKLVQKPSAKVQKGLDIRLSGSAVAGGGPTTLTPSTLVIDWKCVVAQSMPYEVEITIPVENYEPIHFTLTKLCEYKQNEEKESGKGWATFGVVSFVFTLCFSLFCCSGFLYRTKYQNQHGLGALPGITVISACLQTITKEPDHFRAGSENSDDPFLDESVWRAERTNGQVPCRRTEAKYGSI